MKEYSFVHLQKRRAVANRLFRFNWTRGVTCDNWKIPVYTIIHVFTFPSLVTCSFKETEQAAFGKMKKKKKILKESHRRTNEEHWVFDESRTTYLHKLLFINDLFPLVLDPRLPSSVCFNILFISLENFGASSDGDQEL